MFRIVFSAALLIVLAVLVVLNLDSTTNINLFGRQFENVSVVAVGLVAFVAGVVYSFIIYVGNYISRSRREKLSKREKTVKQKEKAEKKGRKALPSAGDGGTDESPAAAGTGQSGGTVDAPGGAPVTGGGKRNSGGLFKRLKRKSGDVS
jgi:uncharacterized integral membrane protein